MESLSLENQTPSPLEALPTNNLPQEVLTRVEVVSVDPVTENQSNTREAAEISTASPSENDKTSSTQAEEGQVGEKRQVEGENKSKPVQINKVTGEKKELDPTKVKNLMTHIKAMMGMQYMRTDGVPAEILPGFYLGSIGAAFNRKMLNERDVRHILCCCDNVKEAYPDAFNYKMLQLLDNPDEDITRYFDETAEYIHEILTKGEKVLVHCFAGKSRSTTMMISYLIKYKQMSVDEALKLIRQKRPVAQPNMGFLKQLRLYEKKVLQNIAPEVQLEEKIVETAPAVQAESSA